MTRPSEAEYPGPLDGVWPEELRPAMALIEREVSFAFLNNRSRSLAEQGAVTDAFTALKAYIRKARALSTPPLPSAEPVARVCTHGRENSLFCLLCDDITREKDLLTALDFARTTGDKVALLLAYRTTPPAAAQDTGPKDEAVRWLAILLAGEYDTEWQDAEGVPLPDLSQSCRDLLDAARAAGGE